jgi:choline dehydrogenase-like flavoprotein
MSRYDVIVAGAGAGGGIAAGVLAAAGKSVLLIERGRTLSFEEIGRDHLRNQRFSRYGVNAGPEMAGHPRVFVDADGAQKVVGPIDGGYSNNAVCVGSGTRVYGAQAWRFMPQDFRMASLYGVPSGSSLSDWPISYEDLAPFYEKVEWEIGVSGDADRMLHLPAYERPYPMPPVTATLRNRLLMQGAASLSWSTVRVPLLINSVPRDGRPACAHCQHCVGFGCPVDAKNGTHNTAIARALQSGRCTLISEAMVERVLTDSGGRATGVAYFDRRDVRHEVSADVIVLAGGAIETARLLINSATDREPAGLGNACDQVGRSLQGHYYANAVGLFEDVVWDGVGPGAATATCRFNHGNEGIVGGGMLADDFIAPPINVWSWMLPPGLPRWGAEPKRWMRDNFRRIVEVKGPVHEIPSPDCRVTVDRGVQDRFGIPVARLSGVAHAETVRAAVFMDERAREWLRASGAIQVWGGGHSPVLSAGQHQAGTCRMGDDSKTSVVDSRCRVHGHDNLYIADGSVHVTNGGFNPVETIMALAWRTAEGIAKSW